MVRVVWRKCLLGQKTPHSLQIPTVRSGGTVLPRWRNGLGWAQETLWGRADTASIPAEHNPTALQALPPLLCYTWQAPRRILWWLEKGMASPSSPGVRGKVGAKPMTTQREGMKANWVNRMGPSPPPDPPSHNWDFLLGRLWFSSHLNLVWSCSMVYLVKAEIQHEKWNDK